MTEPAIVVDNGSSSMKAGFAGEDAPSVVFPTIFGQSRGSERSCGYEALLQAEKLQLSSPVVGGVIHNFDQMEQVWNCCFKQLSLSPLERLVLMTEPPFNPTKNREKMLEIMFEKFQVGGFHAALQPAMSLMASGRETGLVVESGSDVTHAVPIVEGVALAPAILRYDLAGRDLTEFFIRLMANKGLYFSTRREKELAVTMKERLCYVSLDLKEEMALASSSSILEKNFHLPDGRTVTLNTERFICGEALFSPSSPGFLPVEFGSLQEVVFQSISRCSLDVRKALYANIVLAGGNTLFLGIGDRLHKEISNLCPKNVKVQIHHVPERRFLNWLGGSIFSSLDSFPSTCIMRKNYDEGGPSIIHKSCYNAMLI